MNATSALDMSVRELLVLLGAPTGQSASIQVRIEVFNNGVGRNAATADLVSIDTFAEAKMPRPHADRFGRVYIRKPFTPTTNSPGEDKAPGVLLEAKA